MFKKVLVLCLVLSVAFAAKGKNGKGKKPGKGGAAKQEPEGLCLEPEMIMKMCVMGTPFGKAKLSCTFFQT